MQEPPKLPVRFPCWVRAKFSYGGESKHDLGFVEGDLIECLNAGDGSWWMGRLLRDKRVKGLFPSNFIEVLDADFRPIVRSSSPMSHRSPSPFNQMPPQNVKIKAARKPFQSYSAPSPVAMKQSHKLPQSLSPSTTLRDTQPQVLSKVRHFDSKAKSPSSKFQSKKNFADNSAYKDQNKYHVWSRISDSISPEPPIHSEFTSRMPSPLLSRDKNLLRTMTPESQIRNDYFFNPSIPRSPAQDEYDRQSTVLTSAWHENTYFPQPPAPPPHRIIYTPNENDNDHKFNKNGEDQTQASSVSPPSSRGTGLTPSPLRSAIDDVMSSLADMGLNSNEARKESFGESALNPWSPESFDQTYSLAWRNNSSGLANSNKYENDEQTIQDKNQTSFGRKIHPPIVNQNPPLLSNYVQRMENRLSRVQTNSFHHGDEKRPAFVPKVDLKDRPKSCVIHNDLGPSNLRHRRSAYDIGKSLLGRTLTSKTNITNSSSGTQSTATNATNSTNVTNHSLMSGPSAGGISNTSAGSLERKRATALGRSQSAFGTRNEHITYEKNSLGEFRSNRSETPLTGISYHSSHDSELLRYHSQMISNKCSSQMGTSALGGLMAPKPRKSGFFKKMIETAKIGATSARNSIIVSELIKPSGISKPSDGFTSITGDVKSKTEKESRDHEGTVEIDWVQVRQDVNRSNSLSQIERMDRIERCQMMDYLTLSPVDELSKQCEGDEGVDGHPVTEPTDYQSVSFALVDKNIRFINSLPPMTNPISLATGFVCRPFKSDCQRLRAIFTWISQKIVWEEDFDSEIDSRRVIQTKRGCPREVATLVMEMCGAVGIHAEVVHGYLKTPGENPELNFMLHPNHWWNAIIIDKEWRIMDCSLAAPSHPQRSLYSSASSQVSENWWFLTRPIEICWTHIPKQDQQQHLCPPVSHEILLALPCACPPFFKNNISMIDYNTSLIRIEDLELVHVKFVVPADIECVAEVEAKAFARDSDGDNFETGEISKKRALAQAEWVGGQKQYTVKALLPGDEGYGVLKIYAGKRGLMHSIKDIPHPLAFVLPIIHTGTNPLYEFCTRHPTPHAQRHDLYLAQPQCQRLALNNTYVFAVRQHPSSLSMGIISNGNSSLTPHPRPDSAFSMNSASATGSFTSSNFSHTSTKPAKLAIQSPAGKVLRLMRKEERNSSKINGSIREKNDAGTWEIIIKVSEKGLWRGLVLADRTARWCVFAEWTCV